MNPTNQTNPTLNLEVDFKVLASGETIKLSPVSSQIEKAALEIQAIQEDEELAFNEICKLYKIPQNLPESIKLASLLKVREISNGADYSIKYKCPRCRQITESIVMLDDMLDFSLFDQVERFRDLKLRDLGELNFDNIEMHNSPTFFKDANPRNLEDLKDITLSLKARIPKLKDSKTCNCAICRFENLVEIDKSFILKALSDHSISSMYQAYHKLVVNGFSKLDVDSMLPFEREVQLGLIDRMIDEYRKRNQTNSNNS